MIYLLIHENLQTKLVRSFQGLKKNIILYDHLHTLYLGNLSKLKTLFIIVTLSKAHDSKKKRYFDFCMKNVDSNFGLQDPKNP